MDYGPLTAAIIIIIIIIIIMLARNSSVQQKMPGGRVPKNVTNSIYPLEQVR